MTVKRRKEAKGLEPLASGSAFFPSVSVIALVVVKGRKEAKALEPLASGSAFFPSVLVTAPWAWVPCSDENILLSWMW